MKKIVCTLLVFALLFGMMPFVAAGDAPAEYPAIGGSIFFDRSSGAVVGCDKTVTAVDVPAEIDGVCVTSIAASAFAGCVGLSRISIPDTITKIDEGAFSACDALTDVYFDGTAEQWGSIDFTKHNEDLLNALVHFADESVFSDVRESDYFAQPVFWAVRNGITNGVSINEFAPDMICTRGQIVTFLYRACGSPEPLSTEKPFADVSEHSYYYRAVLWAVEKGIANGVSATEFAPEAFCTRAQAVTFLYRCFKTPGVNVTQNPFEDVAATDYYFDAVLWAVENGITFGTEADWFSPNGDCTRAQIVTFLYRAFA